MSALPPSLHCLLCKTSFEPLNAVVKVCQPCAANNNRIVDELFKKRDIVEQQVAAMLMPRQRKRSRRIFDSQYADYSD